MSNSSYIVEGGNWKLRVNCEDCGPYSYIEAATRAIEGVFGNRPLGDGCEFINLYDTTGKDYFDVDCDSDQFPTPMFSVVTAVHKEDVNNKNPIFYMYLSSMLFANAGQPVNYDLALKAEALEPDRVKKFKEMSMSQSKGKAKKKRGGKKKKI